MPFERYNLANEDPSDKAKAIVSEKVFDGDCNHLSTSHSDWVIIWAASPDNLIAGVALPDSTIRPLDHVSIFWYPDCVSYQGSDHTEVFGVLRERSPVTSECYRGSDTEC
jgi:hypothetical protein